MIGIDLIGQEIQGYTITKKLGSGGYGTVYLGVKEDLGKEYRTAIKYISIPDREGYESALQDYCYDKAAVLAYFEKIVEGITSEINTLLELSKKDNRYIVAYYDHDIRKTLDPLRFEIFMRMEYLIPLNSHIRQKGITIGEVIRLGLNMCDALSLCHGNGVMHRDIKEANIFVSEDGAYKLGDFGVAKAAIETTQTGSIKGTASYMAPEIYLREPYDTSVDLYSLGIVLYKLLNNQRLPFMPPAPVAFTADDKNAAETRRLKGEKPPLPINAENKLGEIVVRACSIKGERYTKAEDMREELQKYLETLTEEEISRVVVPQAADNDGNSDSYSESSLTYTQTQGATITMGAQVQGGLQEQASITKQNPYVPVPEKKKKGKRGIKIAAAVVAVVVIVAGYVAISRLFDPVKRFQEAVQNSDFVKAGQLYRDKLASGDSGKRADAAAFLVDYAEEIRGRYYRGEMEYEDALNQLQELGKLDVVSADTLKPMIDEINEMRTSRAAYDNAQKEMEAGDYEAAINDLHKVIQTDANYENAQTQLAEAVKGYKEAVLASLSGFEPEKQYEEAISTLQAGLLIVPDDADFLAKIQDYEKKIENERSLTIDRIIREAKSAASVSEDYGTVLTDLRSAAKQYSSSEALKEAIREVEDAYVEKMLADAVPFAEESEYEEAVALLNEALKLVPENEMIKSAIKEYESKYPVLLQQMTYFTGKNLENEGQEQDNLQGTQVNIVTPNEFTNVYKLNGQYNKITGNWYQPFDERSDGSIQILEIFGDGNLLFSSKMCGGIEPVSFSVNLTGIEELKITLKRDYYYSNGQAKLADVRLYQ